MSDIKINAHNDDSDVCVCAICIDTNTEKAHMTTLPCNHTFHSKCVIEYFLYRKNTECPLCRKPVCETPINTSSPQHIIASPQGHVTIEVVQPNNSAIDEARKKAKMMRFGSALAISAFAGLFVFASTELIKN